VVSSTPIAARRRINEAKLKQLIEEQERERERESFFNQTINL
jgi:hypothetical protein